MQSPEIEPVLEDKEFTCRISDLGQQCVRDYCRHPAPVWENQTELSALLAVLNARRLDFAGRTLVAGTVDENV
jgi:hypothetical protein